MDNRAHSPNEEYDEMDEGSPPSSPAEDSEVAKQQQPKKVRKAQIGKDVNKKKKRKVCVCDFMIPNSVFYCHFVDWRQNSQLQYVCPPTMFRKNHLATPPTPLQPLQQLLLLLL